MSPHDGRSELLDAFTALGVVGVVCCLGMIALVIGAIVGGEVVSAVLGVLAH